MFCSNGQQRASSYWAGMPRVFVVIIVALNLILDFDMIERGASMSEPKYMEWYGAFGDARTKLQKLKRRRASALRGAATAVPENTPAKFSTFTRSVRLSDSI